MALAGIAMAAHQGWTGTNFHWQVASIALPAGLPQPLSFRFVMKSDAGTAKDGIAIDDFHVYNRTYPIYTGTAVNQDTVATSGSAFVSFLESGAIMAEVNPQGQNLGLTEVKAYYQSELANPGSSQYLLPREYTVKPAVAPADSVVARFYITQQQVDSLMAASNPSCTECAKPESAYRLGITQYHDPNPAYEDGVLYNNNAAGGYQFHPAAAIAWVPYDNGYYAELKLASFSEFWFNSGGLDANTPLPAQDVSFSATVAGSRQASLSWISQTDAQTLNYTLQRSGDGKTFETIWKTPARQTSDSANYSYLDILLPGSSTVAYYRLLLAGAGWQQLLFPGTVAAFCWQ